MLRGELFLNAVDILHSGRSLEILGEHGSGRTHLLQRIRDHFITLGWKTIEVSGIEAFRKNPLAALTLAGLLDVPDLRSPSLMMAFRALGDQVIPGQTVIIIDDCDSLDEASWGTLSALSAQRGVPVLCSRLTHRAMHTLVRPSSGFTMLYTLEIPAMGYAELESTLESLIGTKLDSTTMSRVFAKAGGNIGLAAAIIDSARRTGRIVVEEGLLKARGSLWSTSLSALATHVLQPLKPDGVAALRTLALLGPADLETAAELVTPEAVYELEAQRFVSIVEVYTRRIVSVHPPILVEYFRHDAVPGQRAAILERIDQSLAQSYELGGTAQTELTDSAVFVRLAHEQTRKRTLKARETWRKQRSLSAATQLLNRLSEDSAHTEEEVWTLITAAHRLEGDPGEQTDWEIARARHTTFNEGRPEQAAADLRTAAAAYPKQAPRLIAEASEIELSFAPIPETDPLAGIDEATLDDASKLAVVRARAFWLLVRGEVVAADALLSAHRPAERVDAQYIVLEVYAKMGMSDFLRAEEIAQELYTEARSQFDGARLRVAGFLTALSSLFARQYEEAEREVDAAASFGIPSGESPQSIAGIPVLSAYFAARRGQRALMSQYLADLDAAGFQEGILPVQQLFLVYSWTAQFDGDSVGAARVCRKAADELWERGARFAAGTAYLYGLQYHPTHADWEHARPRLAQVDSPMFRFWARFIEALLAQDVTTMLSIVRTMHRSGELQRAAQFADDALNSLHSAKTVSNRALIQLEAYAANNPYRSSASPIELTARESEVAELVASGLSNPQIADALVVSVRTVESHVNKLLKKIGATTRGEVREFLLANLPRN